MFLNDGLALTVVFLFFLTGLALFGLLVTALVRMWFNAD